MPGQGIWASGHTFVAATAATSYSFQETQLYLTTTSSDPDGGTSTDYDYPVGRYGDIFTAVGAPGLVLLHSPGDTFIRDLAAGEETLIRPGALLYKDLSVGMNLHRERPNTDTISSPFGQSLYRYLFLRLRGPGRVAIQSVFEGTDNGGTIHSDPPHTEHTW
jgi:Mitochondrial biogenesis AIM24